MHDTAGGCVQVSTIQRRLPTKEASGQEMQLLCSKPALSRLQQSFQTKCRALNFGPLRVLVRALGQHSAVSIQCTVRAVTGLSRKLTSLVLRHEEKGLMHFAGLKKFSVQVLSRHLARYVPRESFPINAPLCACSC